MLSGHADIDIPREAGIKTIEALRGQKLDANIIASVSCEWDARELATVRNGAHRRTELSRNFVDLIRSSRA
jgi:hypothetical protein